MTFVLDNSVALAWCFEDEQTPSLVRLLESVIEAGCFAPVLWPIEAVNALLVAERRRRITPDKRAGYIHRLAALPVTIDHGEDGLLFGSLETLALQHNLTAYDASYLALALRLGLPLATRDRALIAAAQATGVSLVETL